MFTPILLPFFTSDITIELSKQLLNEKEKLLELSKQLLNEKKSY